MLHLVSNRSITGVRARMSRKPFAVAALLGLLAVAGGAQSRPAPKEYAITMGHMSYGRVPAGIKVGDVIAWVNKDSVIHTATARDKSFDVRVQQGQTVRMTVKQAGTIPIYCIYHPAMRTTLTIAAQ